MFDPLPRTLTAEGSLRPTASAPLAAAATRDHGVTSLALRALRKVRVEAGLSSSIEAVAGELLAELDAASVVVAVREQPNGRGFLWALRTDPKGRAFDLSPIEPADQGAYFFAAPDGWHARRLGSSRSVCELALTDEADEGTQSVRVVSDAAVALMRRLDAGAALLSLSFAFGAEWSCRLFVVDPARGRSRDQLRTARHLIDEVLPALRDVHAVHRLRARAAATERAHLARELHDVVVPALIGVEMRVDGIRRQLPNEAGTVETELAGVQDLLRHEVLNVRDLMRQIRPLQLASDELLEHLADHIEKFRLDTGIRARFFADVRQVSLPSRMCNEIARLIQEALTNVRKHSGARNVDVRLTAAGGRWTLMIEDDGKGLGGAYDDARGTVARWPAPAVIKECVRALAGDLTLHPVAGGGLKIEVRFSDAAALEPPTALREGVRSFRRVEPILSVYARNVLAMMRAGALTFRRLLTPGGFARLYSRPLVRR